MTTPAGPTTTSGPSPDGTDSTLSSPAPALAPGVELLGELSGSGYAEAPSLVRRSDGQTLQVTPLLAALLALVDGRRDAAALAEALSSELGRPVAVTDVEHLLAEKVEPLGLLAGDRAASAEPLEKSNPLLALKFKVVVSDPAVTRRLTTPFAQLFRPWVVVPVLLAFVASTWWVLVERGLGSATRDALYEPHLLLAVVALTIVSAGFHEFGHAAACRYGGADPGAMGAGLYLVWPAFYTDVDDCYRLSRWGRLRVDLGGLYFNAVFAVAVVGLWAVWREDALLLGVAAQLVQMIRQLAPIVRADGYHILADLTGVPDLFSHLGPTLRSALPWNWGRRTDTPLRPWARAVVTAWVAIVAPLLLGLLVLTVLLLPRLLATAVDSLDSQGGSLAEDFASGDVVAGLARLLSLVGLVLPAAAATYLLVSVARRVVRKARKATEGRPVRRGLATTAALLALALVAWAWWPQGQYEPVRADERGTIGSFLSGPTQLVSARPATTLGERTGLALVPRNDPDAPVLLLVRDSDGDLQAVATGAGGGDARAFPFRLPDAPLPGDNQAVALGTEDGGVVYDVAVAMIQVTDGAPVTQTNEAFALASCRACTTVAVAFQVILVIGQSDTVVPVNTAVAANQDCVECLTTAIATQLVVSLRSLPSPEVQAQLDAAWAQLDGIEQRGLTVEQLYAEIQSVQSQLLSTLVEGGLVDSVEGITAGATPTATATATATASATAGPGASTAEATGTPTPSGTSSPAAGSSTPSATASASPSSTASPGPTSTSSP